MLLTSRYNDKSLTQSIMLNLLLANTFYGTYYDESVMLFDFKVSVMLFDVESVVLANAKMRLNQESGI